MGLTATDSGTARTPAPQGTHMGYCFGLIDLGTQTSTFEGKTKSAPKVWLWFELTEEKDPDGKPTTVGTFASVSLNEKATLRKWLEAWRSKPFTAEELKGFKLTNVVGKPCMITIIHKQKPNGGISDVVSSISAMPKGVKPSTAMVHPQAILDLDQFDKALYESLPNFLKDMIFKSPEGLKVCAPGQPSGTNAAGATGEQFSDDNIPF